MDKETANQLGEALLQSQRAKEPPYKTETPTPSSFQKKLVPFILPILTSDIFTMVPLEFCLSPILSVLVGTVIGILFALATTFSKND